MTKVGNGYIINNYPPLKPWYSYHSNSPVLDEPLWTRRNREVMSSDVDKNKLLDFWELNKWKRDRHVYRVDVYDDTIHGEMGYFPAVELVYFPQSNLAKIYDENEAILEFDRQRERFYVRNWKEVEQVRSILNKRVLL